MHDGDDLSSLALAAIIALTLVGNISASIKPIILSSYVSFFGFAVDRAAYIITAEFVAVSVAAIIFTALPHSLDLRRFALAAGAVALVGQSVSAFASSFEALVVIRALTGVVEGLLVCIGAAAITRVTRPTRLASAITICACGLGAALIFGMPALQATFGAQAVFWSMAIITALGYVLLLKLPPLRFGLRSGGAINDRKLRPVFSADAIIILVVVSIYYLGVGGFWPFTGQIGREAGLSYSQVAVVLGYSTVASVAGALVCMVTAGRITQLATFGLALGLPPVCLIAMNLLPHSNVAYWVVMLVYQFCWFLFFPSLMGLASNIDPSGKVNSLIYMMAGIGFAVGPAFGGYLTTLGATPGETTLSWVKLLGICTFPPAFMILVVVARVERRQAAAEDQCSRSINAIW